MINLKEYDLVVIGSGVGLSILNQGFSMGLKIALVENNKFGGTCLTRGCIPSKMLVYPADVIKMAEHAKKIGINLKLEGFDWDLIGKRMWNQINESKGIEQGLSSAPLDIYKGVGEFTGKYTMKVNMNDGSGFSKEFKGKKFVLASGGRPIVLPIQGLEEVGYITSKSFFEDKFPKNPWESLIIIGGGIVACEFAHIFSSFGTKITMVKRSNKLVKEEEPEISEFLAKQFGKYMDLKFGHKPISVRKENDMKILTLEEIATGKKVEIKAEEIFMAAGRKSNADLLKVKNTGIEVNPKGWIKTNEFLETNIENIWAIGDANGQYQFRHKANRDAEICLQNMFGSPENRIPVDYTAVPWAIFTYPQIAHVGMTEKQAIDAGHEIYVAINHYSGVAKGIAMGFETGADDDGFFKMVVDKSYKILGASAIGPNAAILIQPFVFMMNSGYECTPQNYPKEMANTLPKNLKACPNAGSFMPLYKSMIIHPSLNEVTGWSLGKLRPVNIKQQQHGHNNH